MKFKIYDETNNEVWVEMEVVHEQYGLAIYANDRSGEPICGAALDFFDNKMRVLSWDAHSLHGGEPGVTVVEEDVAARIKGGA